MALPLATDVAAPPSAVLAGRERAEALTLLATVFFVAACGLIYELLIATISAYLLGSSVTQFSLCIGAFIGAMGVGSYVSQFVQRGLLRLFLLVEVALGAVGGLSAWALFAAYTTTESIYYVALFGLLLLLGGLVGIELPLLTRLLNGYGALRTVIAQALSFDYVGALVGSVAFPLLLLPTLGTTRTAFLVGLLNVGVAAYNGWVFRARLRRPAGFLGLCGLVALVLAGGAAASEKVSSLFERRLYDDEIVFARQTPYQRIVLTRWHGDLRLFLDGNLQFSSLDEHRYHEALVHPALALARSVEEVLLLGGGDGLGLREVLKHKGVRRVTLVDIDPAMTRLGARYPALAALNRRAFDDPRVRVVHQDAYKFLEQNETLYGAILADLPDPNNEALAKLYSREFYGLARRRLARGGLFVTQATSPYLARHAFWCIVETLGEAGWKTTPYHVYVPSFGDWGFVLASQDAAPNLARADMADRLPLRFLQPGMLTSLAVFDRDIARTDVDASSLDHPTILTYYEREARRWE